MVSENIKQHSLYIGIQMFIKKSTDPHSSVGAESASEVLTTTDLHFTLLEL